MTAARVALVGLACAAASAQAAPRSGVGPTDEPCDPHTTTLRKFMRTPKSFGGPVAKRLRRVRIVVPDATARLLRGARPNLGESAAVIQNDSAAADLDVDDCPVPSLRPLGVLARPHECRPRSHAFSPRDPRGPPSLV